MNYQQALEQATSEALDRFRFKEDHGWTGWETIPENSAIYHIIENLVEYRNDGDRLCLVDAINFLVFLYAKNSNHP